VTGPYVDLIWLPVGAGGRVAAHTSRWWEHLRAHQEHRGPRPLFHSALEVFDGDVYHVIEMAPAWDVPAGDRGVVATGPVGARWLGALRVFRYEIRCWRGGHIPDRAWAVDPPVRFPLTHAGSRTLLAHVPHAPAHVWGRDVFGIGDMWNSNSLISWILEQSDIVTDVLSPPQDGTAPGWRSGVIAANTR